MPSASPGKQPSHRFFVLALGLVLGVIIGFVVALSRLPVDGASALAGAELGSSAESSVKYDFYRTLQEKTGSSIVRLSAPAVTDVTGQVALVTPPATRVVPGDSQRLDPRNLAQENYAEIAASSYGQVSFYLQAGNYRKQADAEQAVFSVNSLGLEAFIVKRTDSNGIAGHRVRVGPFIDRNKVSAAKQILRKGGIPYKIIRVTG